MKDANKIGIGIIGIGWVAHEHIKAWKNNPHCEVVALSSHSRENAELARTTHGLAEARIYTDWADLIRDERVQVVDICSMNHLHVPQGVAAAEAGKHMLIEKPAANDLDGLRQLERAIDKAGVKSLVGFELHWSPYFQSIHSMIDTGFSAGSTTPSAITSPATGNNGIPATPGSRRRSKAVRRCPRPARHSVDAIRQFVRSPAVEVFAYSGNFTGVMEWDPVIATLIRFENGTIGKVGCTLEGNVKYQFNVRLHGANGTLVNDRFLTNYLPGQTGWAQFPTILPDTPDVTHHPFQGELDHLIDCIRENRTPLVDIKEAVKTHEIMFGAEISAREGRPVTLPLSE